MPAVGVGSVAYRLYDITDLIPPIPANCSPFQDKRCRQEL